MLEIVIFKGVSRVVVDSYNMKPIGDIERKLYLMKDFTLIEENGKLREIDLWTVDVDDIIYEEMEIELPQTIGLDDLLYEEPEVKLP